jgi:hypothetical protein
VEFVPFSFKSSRSYMRLIIKYFGFNVHWSVHRKNILIYIQQDATLHSLFISRNCSTCLEWYLHPSSGAQTTVSTASGICQTVTAICRYSILLDIYWNTFTMHGPINVKFKTLPLINPIHDNI